MLILIIGFHLSAKRLDVIRIRRSPDKFKRDIIPKPLNGLGLGRD